MTTSFNNWNSFYFPCSLFFYTLTPLHTLYVYIILYVCIKKLFFFSSSTYNIKRYCCNERRRRKKSEDCLACLHLKSLFNHDMHAYFILYYIEVLCFVSTKLIYNLSTMDKHSFLLCRWLFRLLFYWILRCVLSWMAYAYRYRYFLSLFSWF